MKRPQSPLFMLLAQAEQRRSDEKFSGDTLHRREDEDTAMTPSDIRARSFRRQLLWGLKPEDVTAFLDEVAEAMHDAQILNIEMGTQVKSLQKEVQALTSKQISAPPLDTSRDAQLQETWNREKEKEAAAVVNRLEALRTAALQEVEALLHDAQARTQALSDTACARAESVLHEAEMLKSQRQEEAEELVTAARAAAESIVAAARDEEAAIRQEIERLADSRLRLFDDVRATLDVCHEWLATVDPRAQSVRAGERNMLSDSATNSELSTAAESAGRKV
jgi:DivIVA domain-containing protein